MKKTIMAAAVAAVTLAACSGNNSNCTTSSCKETTACTAGNNCTAGSCKNSSCKDGNCANHKHDKQHKHPKHHRQGKRDMAAVYSGILPAADTDGIRYTLKVDYDDDSNLTKGDYDLVEEYLEANGTNSYRSIKRVKSEGDFTVMTKTVNGKTVKYLRLVPDAGDSDAEAGTEPMYFRVDSNGSITMVNSDLKASTNPGLNYTLTVKK